MFILMMSLFVSVCLSFIVLLCLCMIHNTVQCLYNMVSYLQHTPNTHPIAQP